MDFLVTTVTNDLMKQLNCDIVRSLFMKDGWQEGIPNYNYTLFCTVKTALPTIPQFINNHIFSHNFVSIWQMITSCVLICLSSQANVTPQMSLSDWSSCQNNLSNLSNLALRRWLFKNDNLNQQIFSKIKLHPFSENGTQKRRSHYERFSDNTYYFNWIKVVPRALLGSGIV